MFIVFSHNNVYLSALLASCSYVVDRIIELEVQVFVTLNIHFIWQ